MSDCSINQMPSISAIYFAILQCGYEYYPLERDEAHVSAIKRHEGAARVPPFFEQVRQSTCEVYPFWPRAAILETAAFFLNDACDQFADYDALVSTVMSASNISPAEKGERLWEWLRAFPAALRDVMAGEGFHRYLEWEEAWTADQIRRCGAALNALRQMLRFCQRHYRPACQQLRLVLNPVKCVYASDHIVLGDTLCFTSGALRTESVIHEYLHTIIRPLLEAGIIAIPRAEYPDLDASYYLARDEAGYRNAFEEHAVRALTDKAMQQAYPPDLAAYLARLAEASSGA